VLDALLSLLVPPTCLACRADGAVARGDPLCHGCRLALPWLTSLPRCGRCGLPERHARADCPARWQAFDGAWAPLAYGGPVPALVVALKERGAVRVARTMAAQIAATAPPGTWPDGAALVPVPADPLRARRRGVDHAARLAAELAPRAGLPVARVLARPPRVGARRQAGRSRRERLGAEVAVRVRERASGRPGAVPGHAVLVDDVHTTGATLDACARALKEGGARTVTAVAYARALT
jgi:predicted amidophosphoribosyltransferase